MSILDFRRCDECGRINPPAFYGNRRLCGACASADGFYKISGRELGANGKINYWRLQLPFGIVWRGWWSLSGSTISEKEVGNG